MLTSRSNGATRVTSRPLSITVPAVGCSNPAIMRSTVVLPEPDGPSMEKNSPSAMSRSTPATASIEPNDLRSPASLIAGASDTDTSTGIAA